MIFKPGDVLYSDIMNRVITVEFTTKLDYTLNDGQVLYTILHRHIDDLVKIGEL